MITVIALATLVLGYVAGRLHGRAVAAAWRAEGWRILQAKVAVGNYSSKGPAFSAYDVGQAFGTGRDQ